MKRLMIWLTVKSWLWLSRLSPCECVVLVSDGYMRPSRFFEVAGVEIVWIGEPEGLNEDRMEQFNIMKRTDFVEQFAPEFKAWAEEHFLPRVV